MSQNLRSECVKGIGSRASWLQDWRKNCSPNAQLPLKGNDEDVGRGGREMDVRMRGRMKKERETGERKSEEDFCLKSHCYSFNLCVFICTVLVYLCLSFLCVVELGESLHSVIDCAH